MGPRAVGWPATEAAALNAARIAGKSDDEIRALVVKLHAARTEGQPGDVPMNASMTTSRTIHPACLALPPLPPKAFDDLCASIKAIGLQQPILTTPEGA